MISRDANDALVPNSPASGRGARPGLELGGQFRLERQLGRGGMGEVWKALDKVGERPVVVKLVPIELQRFDEEMARVRYAFQKIHALQHQHICPVYVLGQDASVGTFLVLKFIDGITLSEYRRTVAERQGRFPLSELVRVLRPVAAALDYAHQHKLVHRDVKPQNIMVSRDGSDVQVVDFGLVAEFRTSMTRVSQVRMDSSGTYPYMAPEQWRGQFQDGKVDQYALGVVAYELLSGRTPFEAADEFILRQCVLSEEVAPLDDQPASVNAALRQALAKRGADRFASCNEFVEAIERKERPAAEPQRPLVAEVVARPPTPTQRPAPAARPPAPSPPVAPLAAILPAVLPQPPAARPAPKAPAARPSPQPAQVMRPVPPQAPVMRPASPAPVADGNSAGDKAAGWIILILVIGFVIYYNSRPKKTTTPIPAVGSQQPSGVGPNTGAPPLGGSVPNPPKDPVGDNPNVQIDFSGNLSNNGGFVPEDNPLPLEPGVPNFEPLTEPPDPDPCISPLVDPRTEIMDDKK